MLYYGCYDGEKGKHLALATSQDGLNWERPELGLVDFEGSRKNNLFPFEAVEAGVLLDPVAPPDKRFRLIHNRHWPDPKTAGIYLSHSPDGIHWSPQSTRLHPRVPDSQPSAFWDPARERYAIYLRAWAPRRAIARVEVPDLETPWPFDESVPPLEIWGKEKVATIGTELPVVMQTDDRDPSNVHLYTSAVVRYPWAHDAYLAFPAAYYHFTGDRLKERALDGNDGTFDVQLAVSRNGIEWERFREPWVEPGHVDGLTLQLVSMGTGMIRRGRELHQYFVGWPHTHNRPVKWDRDLEDRAASRERDLGGIYRATSRLDGFVALVAGNEGGTATTPPLRIAGDRLILNIHTAGSGEATVAVLDAAGEALPGYTHDDCHLIHADEVDLPVAWKNHDRLPSGLAEKGGRLQFRLRTARIWALEIEQD